MTFPTKIYFKRFMQYKLNFINLAQNELEHINSKYLNSKFLRIQSNFGFSNGRFWEITDDSETTEITEIHDIDSAMNKVFLEWKDVLYEVNKRPEILEQFQEAFEN